MIMHICSVCMPTSVMCRNQQRWNIKNSFLEKIIHIFHGEYARTAHTFIVYPSHLKERKNTHSQMLFYAYISFSFVTFTNKRHTWVLL